MALPSLQRLFTITWLQDHMMCKATDANGCVYSTTAAINSTGGPTAVVVTPTDATCGSANGSFTIGAVTGGTRSHTYSVDGSAFTTTTVYNNLAVGSHSVEVTDASWLRIATTATITGSDGPTAVMHSDAAPRRRRAPQRVHQRRQDARAARADRMAERDGAAVHVDLRRVEAELADDGQRLRSERFVQLEEIEIVRSARRGRAPCASPGPAPSP